MRCECVEVKAGFVTNFVVIVFSSIVLICFVWCNFSVFFYYVCKKGAFDSYCRQGFSKLLTRML